MQQKEFELEERGRLLFKTKASSDEDSTAQAGLLLSCVRTRRWP